MVKRLKSFPFWSNVIFNLARSFAAHHEKALFLLILRSLFIIYLKTHESGKRSYCFQKESGKSVEFWIQKSVQTLNRFFSSFICYRERALINDYFTLLASLEYNMQEIQKVQKLANDLVDITVTVR